MTLKEMTDGLGEKPLPLATSSTINPTQTDLKVNLGLCSDKTATNYLGHHTAFYFLFM
jgi:hypothetical protein